MKLTHRFTGSLLIGALAFAPLAALAAEGKKGLNAVNVKTVSRVGDPIPDQVSAATGDLKNMFPPGNNGTVRGVGMIDGHDGNKYVFQTPGDNGGQELEEGDEVFFEPGNGRTAHSVTLESDSPIGEAVSGLIDEIRENDTVEFELQEGKKGLNAVNVKTLFRDGVESTWEWVQEYVVGREMVLPGDNVAVPTEKAKVNVDNAPSAFGNARTTDPADSDGDGYGDARIREGGHTVKPGQRQEGNQDAELDRGIGHTLIIKRTGDGPQTDKRRSIPENSIEFRVPVGGEGDSVEVRITTGNGNEINVIRKKK